MRFVDDKFKETQIKHICEEFVELKENWDNYGARAITSIAIEKAIELIENLGEVPPFHVSPTVTGGVDFEWYINDVSIMIEISSQGKVITDILKYEENVWRSDDNKRD